MKYDANKLKEYGFILSDKKYILKKELDNNLYVLFTIDKDINIDIFDTITNELFIPYKVNTSGAYVIELRNKVNKIKQDIINKCFINNNTKQILIDYIYKKYKIKGESPWDEYPNFITFKNNKKWFGLIMTIPYKSLGIDSIEEVDVINVKIEPERIDKLVDNKQYFKAYHMNKKYWITIVLNYNTDIDLLKELLDNSYKLVGGKNESK